MMHVSVGAVALGRGDGLERVGAVSTANIRDLDGVAWRLAAVTA